jgi:tight adherence protein B
MIAGLASTDPTLALALLVGLGVLTAFVGLSTLFVPTSIEERLGGFVDGYRPTTDRVRTNSRGMSLDLLGAFDRQLRRRRQASGTRRLLVRAHSVLSVAEFVAIRVGLALGLGSLVALLSVRSMGPPAILGALVVGFLASLLPPIYLGSLASRRSKALEAQLPDALDLITSSLQAGGALTSAFSMIARDMPAPMSEEFQQILREIGLGLSVGEALTNFAERVASDDLDLVVTTINIQIRVGGNLVQILRTINNTIRERMRIRGEVVVLTSMQRLSSYIVGAIPFVLGGVIFLLNPTYMGVLFKPGLGLARLGLSLLMSLLGFLALQRITKIEV